MHHPIGKPALARAGHSTIVSIDFCKDSARTGELLITGMNPPNRADRASPNPGPSSVANAQNLDRSRYLENLTKYLDFLQQDDRKRFGELAEVTEPVAGSAGMLNVARERWK